MPQFGLGTFKMNDEEETVSVVKKALEIGYRHFDTAQLYDNEAAVGKAIKESGIDRDKVFITTKLKFHHSKENTRKKIMESIQKLGVEYINLLLIHWPSHNDKVNSDTWSVFEEMYQEGHLKAIGVSNFTRYQLDKLLLNAKIVPMINQVELHPGLTQFPLIEYLNNHNIKVTSYGPLMRGNLENEPFNSTINKIAINHNATISQIAIAWGMNRGIIMIPKTRTFSRLEENFKAKNIKLSDEEIEIINNLNNGKRLYSDPSNNTLGIYID